MGATWTPDLDLHRRAAVRVVILLLAAAALAWATGARGADDAAPAAPAEEEEDVDFTPRRGAPPAKRNSAGSRHPTDDPRGPLELSCLAPAPASILGYTTRPAPVVYFLLSRDTDAPLEIGLTAFPAGGDPTPVLETLVHEDGHKAGLVRVDLSQLKLDGGKPLALEPGVRYELAAVVAERAEAEGQSQNPSAACHIERLAPKAAAVPKDAGADLRQAANWYARHGVWFDYLDALNRMLEQAPDDRRALERRRKLLEPEGYEQAEDGRIRLKTAAQRDSPSR